MDGGVAVWYSEWRSGVVQWVEVTSDGAATVMDSSLV